MIELALPPRRFTVLHQRERAQPRAAGVAGIARRGSNDAHFNSVKCGLRVTTVGAAMAATPSFHLLSKAKHRRHGGSHMRIGRLTGHRECMPHRAQRALLELPVGF